MTTDWDRGAEPDTLPPRQPKLKDGRLQTWIPKRKYCDYCKNPVKGWRKIEGIARLCDEDGSIHDCPSTREGIYRQSMDIKRSCHLEDISIRSPEQVNDLVLVCRSTWYIDVGIPEQHRLADPHSHPKWRFQMRPSALIEGSYDIWASLFIQGKVPIMHTNLYNSRPRQDIPFKYLFITLRVNNSVSFSMLMRILGFRKEYNGAYLSESGRPRACSSYDVTVEVPINMTQVVGTTSHGQAGNDLQHLQAGDGLVRALHRMGHMLTY